MKKIFLILSTFFVLACSSNDSDFHDEVIVEDKIFINSYSKDYGTSGEIIKILGEKFPNKGEFKILFDDVEAEIVSVNSARNEIEVKLPEIESGVPVLKFDFGTQKLINTASTDYNSNIGVINKIIGQWAVTKTQLPISDVNFIKSTQITANKKIFLASRTTIGAFFSDNDGLTWKRWSYSGIGFNGDFHALESERGWISFVTDLTLINRTESDSAGYIFRADPAEEFAVVYLEEDMLTGLLVTMSGNVYKTFDGGKTMGGASLNIDRDLRSAPFKLDINNIWSIGLAKVVGTNTYAGTIFYCNGDNNQWNEYNFTGNYLNTIVDNIYFIDNQVGYCILKRKTTQDNILFKTTNGGANWQEVSHVAFDANTSWLVFVDQNHGYLVNKNSILKTMDGGITWDVDFTAENPIQNLNIKDNCLYAFTKGAVVRKFL